MKTARQEYRAGKGFCFFNCLLDGMHTKGKGGDPFWDKAEALLYCALIGYIHYEAPQE